MPRAALAERSPKPSARGGERHSRLPRHARGAARHAQLRQCTGGALELDVTKSATIAAAASAVAAACSASSLLDALVNNAGVLLERDGCDLPVSSPAGRQRSRRDSRHRELPSAAPRRRAHHQCPRVPGPERPPRWTTLTAPAGCCHRRALAASGDLATRAGGRGAPAQPGDTPIYGLSKAGVNFYAAAARQARAAWLGHAGLAAVRPLRLTHNGPHAHAQRPSGPRQRFGRLGPAASPRACPRRGQTRWVVVCALRTRPAPTCHMSLH